jgi:hypothetical protein
MHEYAQHSVRALPGGRLVMAIIVGCPLETVDPTILRAYPTNKSCVNKAVDSRYTKYLLEARISG